MVSYLVDSSVWVQFFRQRGTPATQLIRQLIDSGPATLLGCPPVRMELALELDDLRRHRTLKVYDGFPASGITEDDFDLAAAIYRAVRRSGHTIRSHQDNLIAAIAIRTETVLVHNDVDFDRMANVVTELAVLRLPDS
jgi:predicted nucleic acid-binding protein